MIATRSANRLIGSVIGLGHEAAMAVSAVQHNGGSTPIRRKGHPPMKLHAALDTSATTTALCIVNGRDGSIVLETTVTTNPEAIFLVLKPYLPRLQRVGHEATSWSAWLHRELEASGVPMVLLETHHTARMLEAQRNKTDKNDARWVGAAGALGLVQAGACQERRQQPDQAVARAPTNVEAQADGHRERGSTVAQDVRPDGWPPRAACELRGSRQRLGC